MTDDRYDWPETAVESFSVDGWPILYVSVSQPDDQAHLHRYLAVLGYCPVLMGENATHEFWRFHHPDGPRP